MGWGLDDAFDAVTGGVSKVVKSVIGGSIGWLTPNTPKPPKAILPPTIDEAQMRQIEMDRLRRRRGRAATILSGGNDNANVGTNKLLGGG
jgi:hypothetical protein